MRIIDRNNAGNAHRHGAPAWARWWIVGLLLLGGPACNLLRSAEPQDATPTATAQQAITLPPPTATPTASRGESPVPIVTPGVGQPQADAGDLLLVYTKGEDLWRWQDGKAQQVPLSGAVYAPQISPDHKMIAFLRPVDEFHIELWAANLDGSQERRLVSVADLDSIGAAQRDPSALAINPYHFAWVPGAAQRLAFNTQQVFNGPGLSLLDDLNILDVETGQLQTLFVSGQGGDFFFSPDGSKLAISKSDQIILANRDGSGYRQALTYPLILTYSEYRFYAQPKWSPGGDFLRVTIPPTDALADPSAQTGLFRLPLDGEAVREGGVTAAPFFDSPVVYSPDLQRVAFIRDSGEPGGGQRSLHLATFDGNGDWEAAKGESLQFGGWSPDSRKFVVITGDEMAASVGSLDGPARPLGAPCSGAVQVRWVDASRVVCVAQSPGAFDLTLVDLNGGSLSLDAVTGGAPSLDLAR